MMIEVKDVTKTYRSGKNAFTALKNVSVNIKDAEFVAILGPSGSGKSTLMHLIGGLDRPTEGSVVIDGVEIGKLNDKKIADFRNQNIGFVFQFFYLIPRASVFDNIRLPLIYSSHKVAGQKSRIKQVLASVGLEEKINNKANDLSGGEQQRVALCRALVSDPKIILADEPTGNLDSKNGDEILKLLIKLNKEGKTIIMVTHDHDLAKKADRIVRIKDGEVV